MNGKFSRRSLLGKGALAAGALAGPWSLAVRALAATGRATRTHARAYFSMNTVVEVVAVGDRPGRLAGACEAAAAECRAVDARMNFYDPRSELSRVNGQAPYGWVEASPELFEVLAEAARVWERSEGAFDPAVGAAVRLYREAGRAGAWPGTAQAERAAGCCGFQRVSLDRGSRRVRFEKAGVALDLGGIAKGYAVDRAVRAMKSAGARAGVVNAGGDLYVFGDRLSDAPRAVIEDPFAPGKLAERLVLLEEALCTSGDAEQGISLEGRPCSHLIDPRTAAPVQTASLGSASVRADSALRADAWASALFVRPALLGRVPVEGLLADRKTKRASAGFFASAKQTG